MHKTKNNNRMWFVALLILLISITLYKSKGQYVTNHSNSSPTSLEVQSPQELNTLKDPFKEAIEKQTQLKDGQQILIQPTQVVPNKDPFKEFLEKQAKDLGQSKVSPFGVPADK